MSYTDPCRGGCGASHWPDCTCPPDPEPTVEQSLQSDLRYIREKLKLQEGKLICDVKGHDWSYVFIIYTCKRCGESTDY